jgi:hypothetical protein
VRAILDRRTSVPRSHTSRLANTNIHSRSSHMEGIDDQIIKNWCASSRAEKGSRGCSDFLLGLLQAMAENHGFTPGGPTYGGLGDQLQVPYSRRGKTKLQVEDSSVSFLLSVHGRRADNLIARTLQRRSVQHQILNRILTKEERPTTED